MWQGGYLVIPFVASVLCAHAQAPFDLDQSFQTSINSERISSIALLDNGDLLLSGSIKFPGDSDARLLARVHSNGTRDVTFPYSYGGGGIIPWNGRFYVGNAQAVRRLWPDGTLDMDYDMFVSFDNFSTLQAGNFHVYDDGRVLLCGDHLLADTARGFVGHYNLIWFTNEGKLDTTRIHRKCDGFIYRIFPLPDGKFLLSGNWSEYDGIPTPNSTHLIRIFGDGSLDTTFQAPLDFGRPESHYDLPNGKHLLVGIMGLSNDDDTLQVLRLLPDGGLDSSYYAHLQLLKTYDNDPPWCSVVTAMLLGDDRVIVCGSFTSIEGQPRGGIAMLDTSGHLVNDRFTGSGCGIWNDGFQDRAYIWGITPTPDSSSYYIYGSYHGYDDGTVNDAGQRMVSRLYGLDVGVREEPLNASGLQVYPNPAEGLLHVQWRPTGGHYNLSLLDILGREVLRQDVSAVDQRAELDLQGIASGTYFLHLRDGTRWLAGSKVVVE
jgi:hypothetical protein